MTSTPPPSAAVPELPLATLEAPLPQPLLGAPLAAPLASEPTLDAPSLLAPVPAEPALAPPVLTSTSSASLRAVELPRSRLAAHPATNPPPLPEEELRRAASAAQPRAELVAAAKARRPWALWGISGAALATLVAALALPRGGSVAKRSESASSPASPRSLPVQQETADSPRTEAAVAASPGAESAAAVPSLAPAAANVSSGQAPAAIAAPASGESSAEPASAPVAYNQQALEGALHWGITRAEACHREGRPTGTARATMTFAPSGKVKDFLLEGEPIASAAVGKCISSYLRAVMIPPFNGEEFTITREITLR